MEAEGGEADAATRARLWPMWRRQARQPLERRLTLTLTRTRTRTPNPNPNPNQARQPLERRLSAADMLRQEGNAKFSQADFAGALKE